MKRLWTGMAVAIFLLSGVSAALAGGTLDGKTFTGQMGEVGKPSGQPDDFVFHNGKFTSSLCAQFGYKGAPYLSKAEGDKVKFQLQCKSDKNGGTMTWDGVVKGDQIEGTSVTSENGQASMSWFKGTLKK